MSNSSIETLIVFIFLLLINERTPLNVFRLKAPTDLLLRSSLVKYIADQPGIDLIEFNNNEVQISVPPVHLPSFYKFGMAENGTDLLERVLVDGVNSKRHGTYGNGSGRIQNSYRRRPDNGVSYLMHTRKKDVVLINFNRRPSYNKIVLYLRKLANRFPSKIKLRRVGKTTENEYIFIVSLFDDSKYRAVFLHAGAHGSDWASVMATLYIIQELCTNSHSYPIQRTFTWHFIPVLNPDGYQFSYQNPQKVSSKNRHCSKQCPIGDCGVDILRNFPWNFRGPGSSIHPCSSFYAGPSVFSEVESAVLGQALIHNRRNTSLYIELHGFGRSILYPWSYSHRRCSDYHELVALARVAAQAMNAAGQNYVNYTVSNYGNATYPNSGGPLDYAKRHLGIKYTYVLQMNLQGTLATRQSEILPAILETFAGIRTMVAYVYNKKKPLKDMLRLDKKKRRRFVQRNAGFKIRIGGSLFTFHLITKLMRWLYK